jgi:hypothetical protein
LLKGGYHLGETATLPSWGGLLQHGAVPEGKMPGIVVKEAEVPRNDE